MTLHDIVSTATALTLFLLGSVGLLRFAARLHGDGGDGLRLHPGRGLGPFGPGLGAGGGGRRLLAHRGFGGSRGHQRGQGPAFGGGGRGRSVLGLRGAGEERGEKERGRDEVSSRSRER